MLKVELRKIDAPGRGEVWSLEIEPRQLTLRDAGGAFNNAASLEEASEFVQLPSFSKNRKYTEVAGADGVIRFAATGSARKLLKKAMRRSMAYGPPERIASLRRSAQAELAAGCAALAAGVFLMLWLGGDTQKMTRWGLLALGGAAGAAHGLSRLLDARKVAAIRSDWLAVAEHDEGRATSVAPTPAPTPPEEPAEPAARMAAPRRQRIPTLVKLSLACLAGFVLVSALGIAVISMTDGEWPSRPALRTAPPSPAPHSAAQPEQASVPAPPEAEPVAAAEPDLPAEIPAAREAPEAAETESPFRAITIETAPAALTPGAEVAPRIRCFREQMAVRNDGALRCDIRFPERWTADRLMGPMEVSEPSVGSYLLHVDSPRRTNSVLRATITFPEPILGLIVSRELLDATDALLGAPGTTYPTGGQHRGLFDGDAGEWITLDPDMRTVHIVSITRNWLDQVRVVVDCRDAP